ncbi:aldehyde dehydrogenase family protein [Chryseobacterium lacus]|uniref:Aldehyde dehydrogenase family protein n=1 Tax=Chryseobacterium lacus TaxID=2058346 RepID=A0A368N323_9FLAO|nr:aldehyde dehydrogenase family protein [Chryseobacterium lacus]RCU44024.1 aldehyde dehydrogenase family protein [Chryseobacterium lacus]RST28954.1 aldehyde dehydrogenase family protein [Chryseobacterium lacus]
MENNLQNILDNSQKAFMEWKKTSVQERQKLLTVLSEKLLENKEKFAQIITREMNKPVSQAISEIKKSAGMCAYYAEAKDVLMTEKVETEHAVSEIHYEPMGVILGIMPWNYPFWQALRFAVPAMLSGNVVILKHASICEETGDTLQHLFEESGFPVGTFTHVKASHSEIEEMIASPVIKAVSLTGSEAAGRKVAAVAGQNLKKCVLELGGSDAFIVLEDADINKAAEDAASARLQNCGQTCVAGKRFIIHHKIYDEFLSKFIEEYQKYIPGNPEDPETVLGSMAREDLASELENQYQKAIDNGAKILLPLKRVGEMAFEPGLMEMNAGNPVLDEELFGPLGMVFKAENDDEALTIANSTMFGLANAVYTKDRDKAMFFATHLESGSVAINQNFRSDWRMPFGGRKNSGYGVELSLYALREFTVMKSIIGEV